jgi:hypothetical protein
MKARGEGWWKVENNPDNCCLEIFRNLSVFPSSFNEPSLFEGEKEFSPLSLSSHVTYNE